MKTTILNLLILIAGVILFIRLVESFRLEHYVILLFLIALIVIKTKSRIKKRRGKKWTHKL